MKRLLGIPLVFAISACPLPNDGPDDKGSPTGGGGSTLGGSSTSMPNGVPTEATTSDALPTTTSPLPTTTEGNESTAAEGSSTSTAAETSGGSTSSGEAETSTGDPDACAPTPEFCFQFDSWCPYYFDEAGCASAGACDDAETVCGLCEAAASECIATWGADSPTCVLGMQKCLAAAWLPECACQPAVFPCVDAAEECPAGWEYKAGGGYCAEPCEPAAEPESLFGTGGGPEPLPDCGPAEYATCEDGFCAPHVLLFCL